MLRQFILRHVTPWLLIAAVSPCFGDELMTVDVESLIPIADAGRAEANAAESDATDNAVASPSDVSEGDESVIPAQFQTAPPPAILPRPLTGLPPIPARPRLDRIASPNPRPRRSTQFATRRARNFNAASLTLASIPFMIGDTGSGSCFAVNFQGALSADVEHPALSCSRLNISENNSPLLGDRAYVSYRHFHNTTETAILDSINDLNVDRITLGLEKAFASGLVSVELRLPFQRALNSDLSVIIDDANPSRSTVPLSDRDFDFGNMSTIIKLSLLETQSFQLTGGLALLFPTDNDVSLRGELDATLPVVDDPNPGDPFLFGVNDVEFDVFVDNSTVNISPFLAWLWTDNNRFFHQGFFQVDVAANTSAASADIRGSILPFLTDLGVPDPTVVPLDPIDASFQDTTRVHQQTIMRLNLGCGYQFYRGDPRSKVRSATGILELHYTTTLQDVKLYSESPFSYDYLGESIPLVLTLGNATNRNDILNLATGLSVDVAGTTVTAGIVAPLRDGPDKPFDAEINLQLQRRL